MCVVREAAAFVARVPARTFLRYVVIRATTVSDRAREVWVNRGEEGQKRDMTFSVSFLPLPHHPLPPSLLPFTIPTRLLARRWPVHDKRPGFITVPPQITSLSFLTIVLTDCHRRRRSIFVFQVIISVSF